MTFPKKAAQLIGGVFLSLLLLACKTTLTLNPSMPAPSQNSIATYSPTWSISSSDHRTIRYLAEVHDGTEPATLYNEMESSHKKIKKVLEKQWKAQSIYFSQRETKSLEIQLIKLLATVEENAIEHKINSQIVINVILKSPSTTFNKTFKSTARSENAFRSNATKINAQLDKQLSKMLYKITNDSELNRKLQNL